MSAKENAWKTMEGKWGYGVGVSLLFFLLGVAVPNILGSILPELAIGPLSKEVNELARIIAYIIKLFNEHANPYLIAVLLYIIMCFAIGLITWIFTFGFFACFFDVARNLPYSYKRLFTAFRSARTFINVNLAGFFKWLLIALWSLLLVIPGIMKYYSYSMAELLLVDHPEYSPIQAIDESKKMMQGHRMELFRLQVEFLPWFLLVIASCGVAALWVAPYYCTAKARFYLDLKAMLPASL
ncbi:MAG: DUF975 family protein [Fibrobacter sp.]|nr:DUF975 family protein [Fibrobacter sp.]